VRDSLPGDGCRCGVELFPGERWSKQVCDIKVDVDIEHNDMALPLSLHHASGTEVSAARLVLDPLSVVLTAIAEVPAAPRIVTAFVVRVPQ